MTRGFTLIELLIVVGIIVLVAAMLAGSMTRRGEDAEVAKAAQQLAWELRRARALAIQTGGVHGIAINMETPSGQAPSNQSGTHWYRMFGPSPKLAGGLAQNSIPVADFYPDTNDTNPYRTTTIDKLRDIIRACWRGDPIFLPRNKVRFLALADTDEGIGSSRTLSGVSYPSGYPRPWFGVFDNGTWRPWGEGYSIKADDHDFIVCFLPNGAAIAPEFMRNRRYYNAGTCKAKPDMNTDNSKGQADYPKPNDIRAFTQPEAHERPAWECWWDIPEIAHFTRHTGGWFITLATDGDGGTSFGSADEVLDAILPAFRVHIGRNGSVAVYKVRRQEGFVKGQANAKKWSDIAVNSRCRLAYLHASAAGDTAPWPFPPVGMPITDRLETAMLTDRIWWIDNP